MLRVLFVLKRKQNQIISTYEKLNNFSETGEAKFFSKLNVSAGFWQIPLERTESKLGSRLLTYHLTDIVS